MTSAIGTVRLRRTVRLRLTLFYGAMFCVCGAALLAGTYLLVRHFSGHVLQVSRHAPLHSRRSAGAPGARLPALPSLARLQSAAQRDLVSQHSSDLRELLVWSVVALAATGAGSLVLGWLMAGRVLAPLRTMTVSTRRISQDNLHERLAMRGPADELRELGDTIDDLLGRLERAFEAQQRFVANASHELRTPLARIRTALDVAVGKPGPIPPQIATLDRKIREGLDRADRLMDGLLALGRADHGELSDHTVIALDEIVASALDEREAEIAANRLTVERDLDPIPVPGSPSLIGRMVENVIDNGVRHNHPDGWMRVALHTADGRARLTVETTGDKLDPGQVDQLTKPFRRLRTERTGSANGAGLGLSIVAAVATAHNGMLALHPRERGGLRTTIDLPRAPQSPEPIDLARDRTAPAASGRGAW